MFIAYTRVSGANVNHIAGAADGVLSWYAPTGTVASPGGQLRTVQRGGLSGGNVTIRPHYKHDNGGAGSQRSLPSSATNPAVCFVKNLSH
jgi:hypothetical protein